MRKCSDLCICLLLSYVYSHMNLRESIFLRQTTCCISSLLLPQSLRDLLHQHPNQQTRQFQIKAHGKKGMSADISFFLRGKRERRAEMNREAKGKSAG